MPTPPHRDSLAYDWAHKPNVDDQTGPFIGGPAGEHNAPSVNRPLRSQDPSRFTYTRVYCTPDGETHFENVSVELSKTDVAPPASPAYAGGSRQVSGALFVGMDAHWGADDLKDRRYHPAPAPQYVVVLAGRISVTTTDGETRQFIPGDVVRVEDTTPCKGHITVADDEPVLLMFAR